MKNRIRREGNYELFITSNDNTILTLDQSSWFSLFRGHRGHIIMKTKTGHERGRIVQSGKYYLIEFREDPDFQDLPHLMLEKGEGKFEEWILPDDLPADRHRTVRVIRTDHAISGSKLIEHINNSEAGSKSRKELESKSRSTLYRIAKQKNIKGRSKMDKTDLLKALTD